MMKLVSIFALFLGSLVFVAIGDVVYTLDTQFKGERLKVDVTDNDLAKTPRWEDGEDDPPLSARKAESIARNYAWKTWDRGSSQNLLSKDEFKWKTDSITLKPLQGRRWIYIVKLTFEPIESPTGFYIPTELIVLMNGEVVIPKANSPKLKN